MGAPLWKAMVAAGTTSLLAGAAFASLNGANFYGLPANNGTIELKRGAATMPPAVSVDDGDIVIFRGGEAMPWSVGEVRR